MANLQQIDLPVAVDGELHVDGIAGEQALQLADEGDNRGQRRRAGIDPRFETEKSLEIVADSCGHSIGAARPIIIVDDVVGAAAARSARERHSGHGDTLEHGLHENLVVRVSVLCEGGDDLVDCIRDSL